MIAALLAAVTIGFGEGPSGPTLYYWEIESEDGTLREYATTDWKLTFAPKPYWRWRARSLRSGGIWSEWSQFYGVELYPGDLDGDGEVTLQDVNGCAEHLGDVVP